MTAKYVLWALLWFHTPQSQRFYWDMVGGESMPWGDCRSLQVDTEKVQASFGVQGNTLCLPEGFDPNGGAK
jgi:hypothetical protein